MKTISGTLMMENTPLINFKDNKIDEVLKEDLIPLFFLYGGDIETWLKRRSIDTSRVNSRVLKKALKLSEKDDVETVLSVNAVTLTDNYWFREENQKDLKWEDVKFKENNYADTALNGNLDIFFKEKSKTPELTNIGSFEKCWKKQNNNWYLYKRGTNEQYFSELFIYYLGLDLEFNMAKYEFDEEENCIKSLNFTENNKYNFESMYSLVKENDDYDTCFKALQEIDIDNNKNILSDYLKMIYLDSIVLNVDRHTSNFGLLEDSKTGKIISLAPNFDNNIALISFNTKLNVDREKDNFLKFFTSFLKENKEAFNLFKQIQIKSIEFDDICDIFEKIPQKISKNVDIKEIFTFIKNGQEEISQFVKNLENEPEL